MRFLSHAETILLFQRACVRCGIKTAYSQGFNPRAKLSLPLPRSVGVEADDELLCLRVVGSVSSFGTEQFMDKLSSQLPQGCTLLSVSLVETKISFCRCQATYVLHLRRECVNGRLKARIERLLASKNLNIQRQIEKKRYVRTLDVRPFLKSIALDDTNILVECKIGPAGSIRVDEIMTLLELDAEALTSPIRRTSVKWQ